MSLWIVVRIRIQIKSNDFKSSFLIKGNRTFIASLCFQNNYIKSNFIPKLTIINDIISDIPCITNVEIFLEKNGILLKMT